MFLEHNRYSTNGQFYYYHFWAGELHENGSRVPSAELSAEVCVLEDGRLQSWCLPGGGLRNWALLRGEGLRQGGDA